MNKKFILIMLLVQAVLSGVYGTEGPGFAFRTDLNTAPIFSETTYGMLGTSLYGSVFMGWEGSGFSVGAEVRDSYLTLKSTEDIYNYNGAWNILCGLISAYFMPLDWLSFKIGLGGSWYNSAFSSDDVGTVSRTGPGFSAAADIGFRIIGNLLDLVIVNRFDLIFPEDEMLPVYYGGIDAVFDIGSDWIKLYAGAGVQTFFNQLIPREHDTPMFIWTLGVKMDFSAISSSKTPEIIKPDPKPLPPADIPFYSEMTDDKSHDDAAVTGEDEVRKLETAEEGNIVTFRNIIFYPDTAVIKEESYTVLDSIAAVLVENTVIMVEIRGHTNDLGDPLDEFNLSLERAMAVRRYLTDKGIAEDRMKCAGLGSEYSRNLEITEANRKVEFRILSRQELPGKEE